MLVYIQWTRQNPQGWEPYDIQKSVDIRQLPSKDEPVGGETIDDEPGWIHGIMIQGVSLVGFDHYHPRINPDNPLLVDLVAWNDDPTDFPPGMRWAVVWSFANPRTDPRPGMGLNTEQYLKVYDEQGRTAGWYGNNTTGGPVEYLPWTDFVVPSTSNLNRHGIWVDDTLHQAHLSAQNASEHDWREWVV